MVRKEGREWEREGEGEETKPRERGGRKKEIYGRIKRKGNDGRKEIDTET